MVVSVPEYFGPPAVRSQFQLDAMANLINNSNAGLLSKKGITKLRAAVNWLISAAEEKTVYHAEKDFHFNFKVGFCTLTIPGGQAPPSDRDFKTKLLNPWLTLMREQYGLKNYVWKLELQESGMPHVHITWDTFIHHSTIRTTWNRLLRAAGLIECYTAKFWRCTFQEYLKLIPAKQAANRAKAFKAWERGTSEGWRNPNSTDIHSVSSVKDLAAYIVKYMSKQGQALANFTGRIWSCSSKITEALKLRVFIPCSELRENLSCFFKPSIEMRPLTFGGSEFSEPVKFGEIFLLKFKDWFTTITGDIADAFHKTIAEIRELHSGSPPVYTV